MTQTNTSSSSCAPIPKGAVESRGEYNPISPYVVVDKVLHYAVAVVDQYIGVIVDDAIPDVCVICSDVLFISIRER